MKASTKSGFTLIELLVVIAIIAILAALVIPQIGASLERGKALNDANQLRSLGQIFESYLNEHDDEMPSTGGAGASWPHEFHKTNPDYKIFLSPFDRRAVTTSGSSPVSYGINANALNIYRWEIVSPSEFIVMGPAVNMGANRRPTFTANTSTNVTITAGATNGIFRISKTNAFLNALFADGHVVQMNYADDFSDTASTKGQKHWDPKFVEPGS